LGQLFKKILELGKNRGQDDPAAGVGTIQELILYADVFNFLSAKLKKSVIMAKCLSADILCTVFSGFEIIGFFKVFDLLTIYPNASF
jgi:hypothetical protein